MLNTWRLTSSHKLFPLLNILKQENKYFSPHKAMRRVKLADAEVSHCLNCHLTMYFSWLRFVVISAPILLSTSQTTLLLHIFLFLILKSLASFFLISKSLANSKKDWEVQNKCQNSNEMCLLIYMAREGWISYCNRLKMLGSKVTETFSRLLVFTSLLITLRGFEGVKPCDRKEPVISGGF